MITALTIFILSREGSPPNWGTVSVVFVAFCQDIKLLLM